MSAAPKINKRKLQVVKSEKSTKGSDSLYELLFQVSSDAILLVEQDTNKIFQFNRRLLDLTGFLSDELHNASASLFFPKASERMRSQAFSAGMLKENGFYEDVAIAKKDGYLAFATMSVRSLPAQQTGMQPLVFCILHDIGEKKSMERDLLTKHWELKNAFTDLEKAHMELKSAQEALVQAGKLAALGELAAGVAHELNQPLSGILGFSQELSAILPKDNATAQDFLSEISKNAVRMKKIIQQLREFTRKSVEDFQSVQIEGVIKESLALLEQQFRSRGITVTMDADKNLPPVYCNPFQMEQVFINLFTNSRDAIEAQGSAGQIEISIKRAKKDPRFIEIHFRDNGCGMGPNVKDKAFEPFYTTKEVGKGTGLGLSVSYGILSKINGSVMIESQPGKGAVFHITLPIDYRSLTTEKDENNG